MNEVIVTSDRTRAASTSSHRSWLSPIVGSTFCPSIYKLSGQTRRVESIRPKSREQLSGDEYEDRAGIEHEQRGWRDWTAFGLRWPFRGGRVDGRSDEPQSVLSSVSASLVE